MRIHHKELKTGISRTREFEKKRLAPYAANIGTKCGHGCLYCSTGAMLRTHKSFCECGEDPFGFGYAIIDPGIHIRLSRDAKRIKKRGLVQLCTTVDAWAPEAQERNLGRKCLKAILSQPGWSVRILTKNAAVLEDFDIIEEYKDRVLVGTSITATPDKAGVMSIIEPHASPIHERMSVLKEAHSRGLRTYAMFCPLLPCVADSPEQIDQLVEFAREVGAEEVFAEPVNARGRGLRLMQEALKGAGFGEPAAIIGAIRSRKNWSDYAARLVSNMQQSTHKLYDIQRLRILLYSSRLTAEDVRHVRKDERGVIWLGKNKFDV
jgi:DNA repair photolyase